MTKDEAFKIFKEWHLNTYFVPFDWHTSAHQERKEGFIGGLREGMARAEAEAAQISISK